MKYFKKLVGERIYLSPRNIQDFEIFTQWLNDFETTDYLGRSGNLVTLEAEKKYLEENSSPEATFVIVTIEEDKMIGTVSLEKYRLQYDSSAGRAHDYTTGAVQLCKIRRCRGNPDVFLHYHSTNVVFPVFYIFVLHD